MFNIHEKSLDWGGVALSLESGRMARQADGAVMARLGGTCVLCSVVGESSPRPDLDFFPLSVHYMERTYAAGKIPGGFFKREGRPTEREVLTSRLIDRPIRPLFRSGYRCETQIICTVLSHDMSNEADVVAINGASAALALSGLPFMGPVGAARVGRIDGRFVLNPSLEAMENSDLDLVLAGTRDGVLMVESQARELAEDVMLEAVLFGHQQIQPVLDIIDDLAKAAGKPPRPAPQGEEERSQRVQALQDKISQQHGEALAAAYAERDKLKRRDDVAALRAQVRAQVSEEDGDEGASLAMAACKKAEKATVRGALCAGGARIDGRSPTDVRPIVCEVGVLPLAHGSALFTRGETQALAATTLGTGQDEQIVDSLAGEYREHFMLHYNFPPYCVGETGRIGGVGRREVGHGKLAWRALRPLMPSREDFPYTVRVVAEILESNGSSSMATVCGASLALMDAGVPLARPVAGIAMGLIKEGGQTVILSDIIGDEDHLGDMDFKVAGTEKGVTSLQMDIKIGGVDREIMQKALAQALDGRMHILQQMAQALPSARGDVNTNAPRIVTVTIPRTKIRDLIGVGGKVVREICDRAGARIDIGDDGVVKVAAADSASLEKAVSMIESITAEPEVGRVYDGKVVKCVEFGAFVNFLTGRDGLVHISELDDRRVGRTTDVVREGDGVRVKVLGVDERGKVRLTMRGVNQVASGRRSGAA